LLAEDLFVETKQPTKPSAQSRLVFRQRSVELNRDALISAGSPAQTINLNLFPGRTLITRLHSAEYTDGILRWRGTIEGDPISYAVLLLEGNDLNAHIYAFWKQYEVFAAREGIHQIREVAALQTPFDPHSVITQGLKPRIQAASTSNETPVVQILIVYSKKAAALTVGPTTKFSQLAIDETNMIFFNSKAKVMVDLAGSVIRDYAETGNVFGDLDTLTHPKDGVLDDIHGLRDSMSGDITTLVVSYQTAFGGAGHQMWDLEFDFAPLGFNVVRIFKTGFWIPTFAHEIGHNLGSSHDRCEDSDAILDYSYAYENLDQGWATVMSNGTCLIDAGRISFASLPIFSNDKVKHNGLPMGTKITDSSPANNATSVFYGASVARSWRQNCRGSQPPLLVSPPNGAKNVSLTKFLEYKTRAWPWVEIQIATNSSFQKARTFIGFSNNFSIPLEKGTTYYWRVKGINDCSESSFSETRKFTTRP
jgi:hypothetical protein